ncbi:MAG: exodeoxyribonuclease V subunit alpha [Desulfuromonadaceae bacterium]|nr:exodeoxyribonuclease V subunit alpha [Desulfuromonadaceae bacterium]
MRQDLQIRDIDTVFADFVCRREDAATDILRTAAVCASSAVGQGNICIDLADLCGSADVEMSAAVLRTAKAVGRPGEYCPLILDEANRLYLYRYWKYEHDLAKSLIAMAANQPEIDEELLKSGLSRLFPAMAENPDWQRIAASAAVRNRLTVISGGPGTGKTTTVIKIIALLLEQARGSRMRIGLAAPTGKAAARLKESICGAGKELDACAAAAGNMPADVSTLQRLLGVIPNSCRFRHNADNPLPFEAVVIDEASMVPLALLVKLVDALAPGTRLILLGDRDQLASVEAGAVLGDMCIAGYGYSEVFRKFIADTAGCTIDTSCVGNDVPALADSVVVLQKNYRFGENSGIGLVSRAINDGTAASVLADMKAGTIGELTFCTTPQRDALQKKLAEVVVAGFADYLQYDNPDEVLKGFDRFRVLCAVRNGLYGVDHINILIETCLADVGVIKPDKQWYHGRPVMVTVNDYTLKLFNGDIGIALHDPACEGGISVCFPASDDAVRKILPHRLPAHETVFAMTVHKSQGSEFEKVVLILPPANSPILTREIIYTGLTRARIAAELWCTDEIFVTASGKSIQRHSGLRQKLWESGRTF